MLQIAISNPSKLLCPICTAWEKGPQKLIDKYPPQNEMVYFSLNFRLLDMRMKIQKENSIIFRAHESYKMIDDVNLQNFFTFTVEYLNHQVPTNLVLSDTIFTIHLEAKDIGIHGCLEHISFQLHRNESSSIFNSCCATSTLT